MGNAKRSRSSGLQSIEKTVNLPPHDGVGHDRKANAITSLPVVVGMMEAANRGASEVTGGRSVGLAFVAI